jgi:hypothetical protein
MKLFQSLILSLLIIFHALPLPAQAATKAEVFALPDGCVGETYQTDVEAVLRDTYRLKIETGVSRSILQWALAEGELPPGLAIRTDGKIVGTPRLQRPEPYQFRVKVADMSPSGSVPLLVPLSLSIAPPRLKLVSLSSPALVPLEPEVRGGAPEPPARRVAEGEAVGAASQAPQADRVASNPLPLAAGGGGQQGGPAAPKGCAAGSKAHRMVSDEAHNPLEGDTSTQNTCVQFVNLNILKYRFEFNNKTTRTEGPDLGSLPFIPKLTPTTTSAVTPATTTPPTPASPVVAARIARQPGLAPAAAAAGISNELQLLNIRFNNVRNLLGQVESDLRTTVEDPINQMVTDVQDAHKRSVRLANSADLYLQSNNTAALLAEVATTKGAVDTALTRNWPVAEITAVLNDLNILTARLEDLRFDNAGNQDVSQEAWTEWLSFNQDRYNRVRDRITELKTKVNTINNGAAAFNDGKNVLAGWQLVINNVHNQQATAFRQEAFVSCHTDEGEGKSSKLTISKTDRTAASATAVTRDVLTVNCYSRVAVTGGFNFSTLDEREFSVVQAAGDTPGSTVKKFGFTSRSSFRPNPLMLLNVRFTDRPVYNWHASFGAVVDLKGQTGTDVEPVAGMSVSIRRIIFLTPFAVHFGRVNRLAGGFKEGDLVPESVATPPVEKAWKVGYTAGITFRIAPQ